MITTVLFLCAYGLYCFFKVNRAKSVPWMIANVVCLCAAGLLAWTHQDIYFLVGALCAVGFVAYQAVAVKLPLIANWTKYAKLTVTSLLCWPVEVFETVYTYLSPKL